MKTELIEVAKKLPTPIRQILSKLYNIYNKVYKLHREAYKVEVKLLRNLNKTPKKLNIGGGNNWFKMGWLNLDYYANDAFIDIKQNLLENQKLPFSNESLEIIFTSHVLEHLPDEVVFNLLKECYRTLRKGHVMRISVPDLTKAFEAYLQRNWAFFKMGGVTSKGNTIERRLVNFFASFAMENYGSQEFYSGGPIVNDSIVKEKFNSLDKYEFIRWCVSLIPKDAPYKAHVNGYDYERLEGFLKGVSFEKIYKSSYRNSTVKELREEKFDNRPMASLYVEALKSKYFVVC